MIADQLLQVMDGIPQQTCLIAQFHRNTRVLLGIGRHSLRDLIHLANSHCYFIAHYILNNVSQDVDVNPQCRTIRISVVKWSCMSI